jgi:hypothetical protein
MDLKAHVVEELQRRRGQWKRIAEALAPEVSYSFISQMGRGKYRSDPTHRRLQRIVDYFNSESDA